MRVDAPPPSKCSQEVQSVDPDRSSRHGGFSLVEALVAIAIIGILLAAVVPAFVSNLRINTDNEIRTGAVAASQTVLDRLRVRPKGEWPESGGSLSVSSHGRSFDVLVTYEPFCQGVTCYSGAEMIEVEVSYGSRSRYTVSSVFTTLD
jgi:prepilin-type N-terminal cleavage/methylation domain-containing protein